MVDEVVVEEVVKQEDEYQAAEEEQNVEQVVPITITIATSFGLNIGNVILRSGIDIAIGHIIVPAPNPSPYTISLTTARRTPTTII